MAAHTKTHNTMTLCGEMMSAHDPFVFVMYAFQAGPSPQSPDRPATPSLSQDWLAGWQAGRQAGYPGVVLEVPSCEATSPGMTPNSVALSSCQSRPMVAAQGDGAADGQSQMIEAT